MMPHNEQSSNLHLPMLVPRSIAEDISPYNDSQERSLSFLEHSIAYLDTWR
jgi:hypothetical protein